jgi:hypothetical protein
VLCKSSPAPEVPAAVQQSVRDALRRFLSDPTRSQPPRT